MGITVYNPTSGASIKQLKMAKRNKSFEGSVVAIIDNGKKNSDHVLNFIGDKLKEQLSVKEVIFYKKGSFSHGISNDEAKKLASQCDFTISGIGD